MKYLFFSFLIFFGTFSIAQGDTLFYIVSLDCQYCGKMSEESADKKLSQLASNNGIEFKTAAFGPYIKVGSDVKPHPLTKLFWAATVHSPKKSLSVAEVFFRSFSGSSSSDRRDIIDNISINASIEKSAIRSELNKEGDILGRWRKTAKIISEGMEVSGANRLNTPAFAFYDGSKIIDYIQWQGSVEDTVRKVKEGIKSNE